MQTKELKKVKKFDKDTINEFIKGLVYTREEVKSEKENIDKKREDINKRLEELEQSSDNSTEKDEEINKLREELSNIDKEENEVNSELAKWEEERERIELEIDKKIQANEQRKIQKEEEIQKHKSTIEENNEKINEIYSYSVHEANGMEDNTDELNAIEEANKKLKSMIANLKRAIKRADKTNQLLLQIKEKLIDGKEFDDLVPPKKSSPKSRNTQKRPNRKKANNKENKENDWDPSHFKTHRENGLEGEEETKTQSEKVEAAKVEPENTVEEKKIEVKTELPKSAKKIETAKKVLATEEIDKAKIVRKEPLKEEIVKPEPIKEEPKKVEQEVVTKPYSEMTEEELKKKQRELFAKIIEGDDYYFRAHEENGMEGYESDKLDDELKAVREELERRNKEKQEVKEEPVLEIPTTQTTQRTSLFVRFVNTVKNFINRFTNRNQQALPAPEVTKEQKAEYVEKANKILEETVATKRIFESSTRYAMRKK